MDSLSQESMTMEKILKKVYDVHRQALTETNAKLSKCIANNERLEEKVKQLQIDKEHLLTDSRQMRTGECCKVISTTLQTVTSSYEQLLQEKDARIRELEAELRRRKRGQNTSYIEDSQDEQSEPAREARRFSRLPKQSPDSTSTVTNDSRRDSSSHSQSSPQQSQTKYNRKETVNSAALKKLSSSEKYHSEKETVQDDSSSLSKKLSSNGYSSQTKHRHSSNVVEKIQDKKNTDTNSQKENNTCSISQTKSKQKNNLQESQIDTSKVIRGSQSKNNKSDTDTIVSEDKTYDDLVFDDALAMVEEESQMPKLQMRRNKRSRYSENQIAPMQSSPSTKRNSPFSRMVTMYRLLDKSKAMEVSPEMKKRSRQVSPSSSKSPITSPTSVKSSKLSEPSKPAVFVPDTCTINLDDSHVEDKTIAKSKDKRLQKCAGKAGRAKSDSDSEMNTDFDMLVVPETLAMDADSDLSEEDVDLDSEKSGKNIKKRDVGKKYKPDLSDIRELSVENSGKEKSIKEMRSYSQEKGRNASKSKSSGKGEKADGKDENDGIKSSLRSLLNSPRSDEDLESDKYIAQAVSSRDLDLGLNDSIVLSDEEDDRESQMNESKLTKKMFSLDRKSKALRMSEVDAMFETPEKRKTSKGASETNIERKKPLFKKQIENEQQILRRSPRKHGKTKLSDEQDFKTSPKSRQKGSQNSTRLSQKDPCLEPKQGSFCESQSKTKTSNKQYQAPQKIESQSVDEYNIIPVQNGVPQTSEMFQFKVAKRKENGKKSSEKGRDKHQSNGEHLLEQRYDEKHIADVEKSPSILESKAKGQDSDAINLLSPAVGSTSDAESPLLLQNHRLRKSSQSSSSQQQTSPNKPSSNKSKSSFKKPLAPRSRDGRKKYYVNQKIEEDLDETVAPDQSNHDHSAVVLNEINNQRSNVGSEVNGSLDPAAELSIWCKEPETEASCRETTQAQTLPSLPSLDDDFCMDDLHNEESSIQRTSTLAMDDSQDIPSSSRSYKFGPRKKLSRKTDNSRDIENIDPEPAKNKLDDSFDRVPKKADAKVAHVAVVRKQDERQKLQGHSCKQCLEYYQAAGLGEDEIKHHMQKCSRHRAEFVPPDTPPHFWSVGFIDTQECVERGYMKVEKQTKESTEEPARFRRRRKLNKYFKSKNETSTLEPDSQDDF